MPVSYNPPYDSPIEDIFALYYVRYASEEIDFIPQFQITTLCGLFIVDFVIQDRHGYKIGIECDGKEYHDESRDEWRDAMIIGDGHLDAIYRVRGRDINFFIEDVMYLLAKLEPGIFGLRAAANLEVLASPEIQSLVKSHERDHYHLHYQNEDDIGSFHVEVRRHIVPLNQRRFWQAAYRHAVSVGGGKLDDVIASYRNKTDDGI